MNWYCIIGLGILAVVILLLAPDTVLPSVMLAYLVIVGYAFAWIRNVPLLLAAIVLALCLVATTDTAVSVLLQETQAETRLERVMEVGPAVIMSASIAAGYAYSWMHRAPHMLLCMFLAVASLVLGW